MNFVIWECILLLGGSSLAVLAQGGAGRQVKEVGHIIFPGSNKLIFQGTILEYCISDDNDGHKHTLRTGSAFRWLTCHSRRQPWMGYPCSKALMTIIH